MCSHHSCLMYSVSCLTSPVSRLLSHVSCLTSPVSRLLSHVSCLTLPVSCLTSPVSCLTPPVSRLWSHVSHLLSPISCLTSPVSRLLSPVSCLTSRVSNLLSHVPCLRCPAMCQTMLNCLATVSFYLLKIVSVFIITPGYFNRPRSSYFSGLGIHSFDFRANRSFVLSNLSDSLTVANFL